MKLGIKVGPQKQSLADIAQTHPDAAEVWFNIHRVNEYSELFDGLKKESIAVGLHYWGALADGTWTNLAYPDSALLNETLRLMKKTIDIAAQNGFVYVNIHPGTQAKVAIDFVKESFRLLTKPVDLARSQALFLEHAHALHEYAKTRNVLLTVETVPARVTAGWYKGSEARLAPYNIYELPVLTIVEAAHQGLFIANDFCHTAANVISDDAGGVWTFLQQTTRELLPQTRLIHLGFVVPPYNGTDNHDMLDNPLLNSFAAVPNKQQMVELLKLFKDRDDVYIITEPKTDHVKNYHLARDIVETASSDK